MENEAGDRCAAVAFRGWTREKRGDGGVSEDRGARASLDRAAFLAARMRAHGRWHRWFIALLGLVMFALVLGSGLLLRPPLRGVGFTLALMSLLGLVVYTASRRVVPRHHRLLYAVVTPLGALVYALTVVLGAVFFPGVLWWWLVGAALCTLPFWVFVLVNVSVGRRS